MRYILLLFVCLFVGTVNADTVSRKPQESVEQFVSRLAPNAASQVVHVVSSQVWGFKTPLIIAFYEYPVIYANKNKNYGDSPADHEVLGVIYVPLTSTTFRRFVIDGYGPEGINAEISAVFFANTDRTSDKKLFVMVSWHNNNGALYSTFVYDKPQINSTAAQLINNKQFSQMFGMECDHCPNSDHPDQAARYKSAADVKAELKRMLR